MTDAAITVDDVAKRFRLVHERNASIKGALLSGFRRTVYDEFWALDGVSFEVPRGATFALVGENGSGKSTLLKCMAKIYRPDRGTITTRGKMCALLELGAGFHPELSGRENVYLNGAILGLSKVEIDRRFDDIVGFAGLERFIETPVKNYSSGMFVRLGFSVAINVEPEILLVDEVLAVGDEQFQQRCLEKFADLRRQGRTVVVVSHGLDMVRNICDAAVWLEHGHLRYSGTSGEVVGKYLDEVRSQRRAEQDAAPHAERDVPAEGARLSSYRLLDGDGRATTMLTSRSQATIEVDVAVPDSEPALLQIDVLRNDGVHIGGVQHLVEPGSPGHLRYEVDDLRLHAGSYELSFALFDRHVEQVLDRADHAIRFDVTGPATRRGFIELGGDWS